MAATKAATRYAKALLDLAIEQNLADQVNHDMLHLKTLCYESHDLTAFLESPIIQKSKKLDILDVMFKGKVQDMTLGFYKLITKNKRENILEIIAEAYIALYKKHKGILDVDLTSATKLEDKVKQQILAKVQDSYPGKTIELSEELDESLIGGFVVGVDGKQIDASIASQLSNLKNILLN